MSSETGIRFHISVPSNVPSPATAAIGARATSSRSTPWTALCVSRRAGRRKPKQRRTKRLFGVRSRSEERTQLPLSVGGMRARVQWVPKGKGIRRNACPVVSCRVHGMRGLEASFCSGCGRLSAIPTSQSRVSADHWVSDLHDSGPSHHHQTLAAGGGKARP